MFQKALAILMLLAAVGSRAFADAATFSADVIIYGGTSAGVAAAIQATRMGKKVVLISPQPQLGGMTTNGLSATDSGNKAAIGGIAREFYQNVKKYYDRPVAWKHGRREDYAAYRPADDAMWMFEPHVAEEILEAMLRESNNPPPSKGWEQPSTVAGDDRAQGGSPREAIRGGITAPSQKPSVMTVVRNERLIRGAGGVEMKDNRIAIIRTEPSSAEYHAPMFIDATYEGDLLAAAGVSYTVGRESNDAYGETCNGVQKSKNVKNHRFLVPVDPFIAPGNRASGLLAGVQRDPPGDDGQGDRRIQAYCFRMCMSNVPENRTPFPKPADYDETRYELLFRNFEAGDLRIPFHAVMMPNGKTDTNNNGAVSTDNIGMNYDYPEASYERRAEILWEHISYQQGLMWMLAHHSRIPAAVREHMRQWGLAADEFKDNGHWPTEIYVREARRMIGDYVMTEQDARLIRQCEDSIGMASYNMDSHNCQRYVDAEGRAANEGDVQVPPRGPYAISYRSIVPKRGEAENLLVPVCLSASHIAYGSIRMEPVFMILGQSAATAACQAIDAGASVQDIDYAALRARLLADGQVLAPE